MTAPNTDRPARRLTIVQCVPALRGGGVERGTLEISRAIVARGHRSVVISAGGRMVEQLVREGAEHVEWPIGKKSLGALRLVRRLLAFCVNERVDILHARSRVPAWVCLLAWRGMDESLRPRFITTMHGVHSVSRYSEVMTKGECVIAVSETVRTHIADAYPHADLSRVTVIPRGVDPAEFPYGHAPSAEWLQQLHAAFPRARGRRLIVLPGRVTRLKGHADAIRALHLAVERGVDAHLLVVGGVDEHKASLRRELDALAGALGVTQRISFAGHRSDIREWMAACDVTLSCSTQPESFGRTALEAISLGKPVIGYDHGGVGEVLGQVFPAGLVPANDWRAMGERLIEFAREAPRVEPTGRYTLAAMQDATIALYEEVARG
ncbi:MAG: glycosyltransferase family 4 protein [Phycisphaerales bacterium]